MSARTKDRCRYWCLLLLFLSGFLIPVTAQSVIRMIYIKAYHRLPYGESLPDDNVYLGLATMMFDMDDHGQLNFFQVIMDHQVVVENTPVLLTFLNGAIHNNWGEHMLSTPGELRIQTPAVTYSELTIYMLTGWHPQICNISQEATTVHPVDERGSVIHYRIFNSGQGDACNRIFGVTKLKNGKSGIASLVILSFGDHELVLDFGVPSLKSSKNNEEDKNDPDAGGAAGTVFTLMEMPHQGKGLQLAEFENFRHDKLKVMENKTTVVKSLPDYSSWMISWKIYIQWLVTPATTIEEGEYFLDR